MLKDVELHCDRSQFDSGLEDLGVENFAVWQKRYASTAAIKGIRFVQLRDGAKLRGSPSRSAAASRRRYFVVDSPSVPGT
jgi:hypothetical protein